MLVLEEKLAGSHERPEQVLGESRRATTEVVDERTRLREPEKLLREKAPCFFPSGKQHHDVIGPRDLHVQIPDIHRELADAIEETDPQGNRIVGDTLLWLLNANPETLGFTLPPSPKDRPWELVLDTREARGKRETPPITGGQIYEMEARSLTLFRIEKNGGDS